MSELEIIRTPADIESMYVLLNQKCNFSCKYCYSSMGRSNEELSEDVLRTALDFFVIPERGKQLNLIFTGGGDPLLSFQRLRYAVQYARERARVHDIGLNISVVSNGSLISDEEEIFFRDSDIDIIISFDVIEEVQNAQRSHYDVVSATIDKLIANRICPGIRSTVTPLNVSRMVEMVETLHQKFPKLRFIALEAVLNDNLFPTIDDYVQFNADFVENYYKAVDRGEEIGVEVGNTIHNSVQKLVQRGCSGKFVLTSDASLTACSRISTIGDPFYDYFKYGNVTADGVKWDSNRYSELMDENVNKYDECRNCVARLHCGGGCLLARKGQSPEYFKANCSFMVAMTREALKRKIERWLQRYSIYEYKCDTGENIYYSPLARTQVRSSRQMLTEYLVQGMHADVFDILKDYKQIADSRSIHEPKDYNLLTVLPNNVCNFSCPYCYSAMGRTGNTLSIKQLKTAIDYFIGSKPDDYKKPLTISYMGGGEPMLAWNIVRDSIIYAEERAAARNFSIAFVIITNGSLLDDGHLDYILNHHIQVSVSFEIIPEIQNLQRKHYAAVSGNLHKLLNAHVPVQINATITPANVHRMHEMMQILVEQYPGVEAAMFEPVISEKMFDSPEEMRTFYDDYIVGFIDAFKMGRRYNIHLTSFPYLRTLYPLERTCSGEFCITAEGKITGCYCVSSPHEKLFKQTCYGEVTEDGIKFDLDCYNALMAHNVYSLKECHNCRVKWNCGGGCFYQFGTYSEPYRREVCIFTERFVEAIVRNQLN